MFALDQVCWHHQIIATTPLVQASDKDTFRSGAATSVKKSKKAKAKEIPQDAVDGYSGPDPRSYDSTRGRVVETDFLLPDLR